MQPHSIRPDGRTPSHTFEAILEHKGLTRRARQDTAVSLAHVAVRNGERVIIQAPTGVGKSFVALATAADVGVPGHPGIVATITNQLGDQYLADCRDAARAAGFTYTRVMGRTHYLCADSAGAQNDHDAPPTDADVQYDQDTDSDNSSQIRAAREAWLENKARTVADPACHYELRQLGLDRSYACKGFPECGGTQLGGCGAKAARARGYQVDVVITNFHMLAFAHKLPDFGLLPLQEAPVVVIDEAHELPSVIAEIDGGEITEGTGSEVFSEHPDLADAALKLITGSLDRTEWTGNSRYDREGKVPVDLDGIAAFANACSSLDPAVRDAMFADRSDDPNGKFRPGDVVSLLRHFFESGLDQRAFTWRAWSTRSTDTGGQWLEDRTINLRRTDAAEDIVPAMLPRAAVLMTGTVGQTLPARLGLPDVEVHDLGQEFDWTRVRGWVSQYSGVKTGDYKTQVLPRYQARGAELAAVIRGHRGSLVLVNAHEDIATVARLLQPHLPGVRVFTQPKAGGSLGAGQTKDDYVRHVAGGARGVLIGTNSYATGVDLKGDLCTLVAWWVCHPGVTGYYDGHLGMRYPGYIEDRFRSRFAQGIGRLLRTPSDTGQVVICDNRAYYHIKAATTRVDKHLSSMDWNYISVQGVA